MRYSVHAVSTITGKHLRVIVTGASEEDARTQAREQGLYPYRIKAARTFTPPWWMTREGRQQAAEAREQRRKETDASTSHVGDYIRLGIAGMLVLAVVGVAVAGVGSMLSHDAPPDVLEVDDGSRTESELRAIAKYSRRDDSIDAVAGMLESGVAVEMDEMIEGYFYLGGNGAYMQYSEFLRRYRQCRVDDGLAHTESIKAIYKRAR